MAVSQYRRRGRRPNWPHSSRLAAAALSHLPRQADDKLAVWNVNLPDIDGEELPDIVLAPLDRHPLPIHYEAVDGVLNYVCNYHERPRDRGSDVDECFAGRIAISRLPMHI